MQRLEDPSMPVQAGGAALRLVEPLRQQTRRRKALATRLLREPLAHFLLIAALIYALSAAFRPRQADRQRRVDVTAAEIKRLRDLWAAQWGHPPNPKELNNLIADSVREEILYREAIASGLDREDSIIRRRLVQKMEFLIQDPSLIGEPTDKELEVWYQQHRDKYAAPPLVSFSHVSFSRSLRSSSAGADARRALDLLRARHAGPRDAGDLGDAFIGQYDYSAQSEQQTARQFGPAFAHALPTLEPGSWQGPIESIYGSHLIWISEKSMPTSPPLDAVRSRVLSDVMNERLHQADERALANLRAHYQVNIDRTAESRLALPQ